MFHNDKTQSMFVNLMKSFAHTKCLLAEQPSKGTTDQA